MKIAVLGTGVVGRTVSARLAELGHDVVVGTRDPDATRSRPEWAELPLGLATFAEAAADSEVIVNASSGVASLEVLGQAGTDNLAGKVLLDISNPLDFSQGRPPTLFVKDTDSLAEQIQRAFPEARVVKSLNMMNASMMVHPEELPEPGSVFVSGDDAEANATVAGLLAELGHQDVIELGDLSTARGVEMALPLWMRLMGALDTVTFNFKIVR